MHIALRGLGVDGRATTAGVGTGGPVVTGAGATGAGGGGPVVTGAGATGAGAGGGPVVTGAGATGAGAGGCPAAGGAGEGGGASSGGMRSPAGCAWAWVARNIRRTRAIEQGLGMSQR